MREGFRGHIKEAVSSICWNHDEVIVSKGLKEEIVKTMQVIKMLKKKIDSDVTRKIPGRTKEKR